MANTRPTKLGFMRAFRLCWLLLVNTRKFIEEEEKDKIARNNYSDPDDQREHAAYTVRRAFVWSFLLVVASAIVGYVFGFILNAAFGCTSTALIVWLQIAGASFLLWGTLFVRGWQIQSFCGVTFTERVNLWIYRFMYCVGTAVFVCSLAWSQCA
ncbi:MAG: hypothetical protein IT442_00685 [Phycisphaeraceae bacterium]|nr:hypothetical protein [Phycisphaeraceae bacterium]